MARLNATDPRLDDVDVGKPILAETLCKVAERQLRIAVRDCAQVPLGETRTPTRLAPETEIKASVSSVLNRVRFSMC